MSLDDEVRKHLRDTGEQVALTPGIVDAVRVRAATRLRRRRRLLAGLGFLAGVALVGGSLAVILPALGNFRDRGSRSATRCNGRNSGP